MSYTPRSKEKQIYLEKLRDAEYVDMKIDDFIFFESKGQTGALVRLLEHVQSYTHVLTDEMIQKMIDAFERYKVDLDVHLASSFKKDLKKKIDQYKSRKN